MENSECERRFARAWSRLAHWLKLDEIPRGLRRLLVALIGGTLLLLGIVMIVLPGPAFIVIPLALAVLASEFVWARRCVRKARELLRRAKDSGAAK